ncbi:MAG: cyclic nucleotide-binding domain-containing protein [Nitrospinae bacterium]|nr:cyclic nucleotide-binding domain-containing protein [Nitrospinota bacterium]
MINKKFNKGEVIIEEGSLSTGAYIIDSGSVEVSKKLPNGSIQVITKLDKNDIFGEMGLIDQLPRSATVRALEDCSISIMTPDTFNSLAKRNPKALMPILKVLAKRLRNTLKIIEEVEDPKPQHQTAIAGNI